MCEWYSFLVIQLLLGLGSLLLLILLIVKL